MKKAYFIACILIAFIACKANQNASSEKDKKQQGEEEAPTPNMHNSPTSLDYQGTYYGLIPCADCMGILIKLTLKDDNIYTTESLYLGASDSIYKHNGRYDWDKYNREIVCRINNKIVARYKVGENKLIQFGQQGQINGKTEARYVLYKNPRAIWNKLWFATSIKNKEIKQKNTIPHLTFLPNGNVYGSGGCNQLNAKYSLNNNQMIKISTVASTKKGCEGIKHYDIELSEAMRQARFYEIIENKLYLKDASDKIIAKFKAQTID